jgi:hypothetical protein
MVKCKIRDSGVSKVSGVRTGRKALLRSFSEGVRRSRRRLERLSVKRSKDQMTLLDCLPESVLLDLVAQTPEIWGKCVLALPFLGNYIDDVRTRVLFTLKLQYKLVTITDHGYEVADPYGCWGDWNVISHAFEEEYDFTGRFLSSSHYYNCDQERDKWGSR